MSEPLLVVDPGSCHAGRKKLCFELIDEAKKAKADVIKFQLFPNTKQFTDCGNIPLNYDWFGDLFHYGSKRGMKVTASCFDQHALDLLMRYDVPFIKFSYSQTQDESKLKHIKGLLETGRKVMCSTDVMNISKLPDHANLTKLFCQPIYPTMHKTNFENLFPIFDGFSDHSLGITEAIEAVNHGARVIEKHMGLPYKDTLSCPDGAFCLMPNEVRKLSDAIKGKKDIL